MRINPDANSTGRLYNGLIFFLCACLFILLGQTDSLQAAEQLIHEENVSVNKETWSGGSITWSHNVPADILARATRVEAVIGASDVDYPDCSQDCPTCAPADCEHDRLYVNNSEIGLLSGSNDSTHSNPITVPLALFTAGANTYRVDNEVVGHNWWLKITDSSLKFYQQSTESGDEPGTPGEQNTESILQLKKYQDKTSLLPGDIQEYKIKVENKGNTPLTAITISDRLDSMLEYESNSSSFAHQVKKDLHIWSIPSLAAQQSTEIRFTVRVKTDVMTGKSISNKAEARAAELHQLIESNTVTAISSFVPVEPKGLRVTKRLNRRQGRIGRILSYRILIENISHGTVFNLLLEDILPQGFSLVKGSVLLDGQPFTDPRGSRRLEWSLNVLPPGDSLEISYQAVIGANVKRGQNSNRAVARGVDGGGTRVTGEDSAIVMIGAGHIEVPAEIEAQVFLDHNGNGLQNADDHSLADIEIILSNGDKKRTNAEGKALFTDIISGYYALSLNQRNLPEYTSPGGETTRLIRVMEGERARIMLPLVQNVGPARLEGLVFYDRNQNGQIDQKESRPEKVTIIFDTSLQTAAENGRYVFTGLTSGRHKLQIRAGNAAISREVNLEIGNNIVNIPLKFPGISLSVGGKK